MRYRPKSLLKTLLGRAFENHEAGMSSLRRNEMAARLERMALERLMIEFRFFLACAERSRPCMNLESLKVFERGRVIGIEESFAAFDDRNAWRRSPRYAIIRSSRMICASIEMRLRSSMPRVRYARR